MRSRVWRLERQVESSRNIPLLDFTPTTGILVENSYMFWFEPEPRKTQRHSRLWKLSGVHQNLDLLTNVIMQRCSSRCTCWKTRQSHSKNNYCFNQHICGSIAHMKMHDEHKLELRTANLDPLTICKHMHEGSISWRTKKTSLFGWIVFVSTPHKMKYQPENELTNIPQEHVFILNTHALELQLYISM